MIVIGSPLYPLHNFLEGLHAVKKRPLGKGVSFY